MITTFIDEVLAGHTKKESIDDFVNQWHKNKDPRPLHKAIGFTRKEYALWVSVPITLDMVIVRERNKRNTQ